MNCVSLPALTKPCRLASSHLSEFRTPGVAAAIPGVSSLCPSGNPRWTLASFRTRNEQFFARSRTIPRNSGIGQPSAARLGEPAGLRVSQIKELRGDVPSYVKPEIPQIDKEIAGKARFWTETNCGRNFYKRLDCVKLSPLLAVLASKKSGTFL